MSERTGRWWRALRAGVAVGLTYCMVCGSIPTPALAKMAEVATEATASGEVVMTGDDSVVGAQSDGVPESPEVAGTDDGTAKSIAVPKPVAGLVFDGTEKTGVETGEGYELSSDVVATHAGNYVAIATLQDGYIWDDGTTGAVEVHWTIDRKSATVKAEDKTKTFGSADPQLTAQVDGLVGQDEVAYELSRESGEEPGEYAITAAGNAEQGDYAVTFVAGKLVVEEPLASASQEDDAGLVVAQDGEILASGTWGTCSWEINAAGTLTVRPGAGQAAVEDNAESPWATYANSITSVVFAQQGDSKVTLEGSASHLFQGLSKVAAMDLSGFDTSGVTDMSYMFADCPRLTSLDLSGFTTTNVKNMSFMFSNCPRLTQPIVSGFNTAAVTDMRGMFSGCSSLENLDLSGWEMSSVLTMGAVNTYYYDDSYQGMFSGCTKLKTLDVSGWVTSSVTNIRGLFSGCSSLTSLDLSDWDTQSVTSMRDVFSGCSSLTSLDVAEWVTSSVTDMHGLFSGCSSLTSLDVSDWDTKSVTCMGYVFSGCTSLASLDVADWKTSAVTDMTGLFSGCSSLTSLDVADWATSSVTDMGGMFSGCSSLTTLDVADWDTQSVTDMRALFAGCSSLVTLDVADWDTQAVTNMGDAFSRCTSLVTLDLSSWDTQAVAYMGEAFNGCSSLASFKVGQWYVFKSYGAMPFATNSINQWWSTADHQWFTQEQIVGNRSGKPDTYTSQVEAGYEKSVASLTIRMPDDYWYTDDYTYSGEAKTPKPEVLDGEYSLYEGVDYTLSYKSNENAGTATVTVTGKGNYTGTRDVTFTILPFDLGRGGYIHGDWCNLEVSNIPDETYNGKAHTPKPTVKLGSKTLKLNTDYTLSYSDNVNAGRVRVSLQGKGNYTGVGMYAASFYIQPADISKASVTLSNQQYIGDSSDDVVSKLVVKLDGRTLKRDVDYSAYATFKYDRASSDKTITANVTVYGEGNYSGQKTATYKLVMPSVTYRTHVQTYGWQGWAKEGQMSGTSGQSKRLEGIEIKLENALIPGGIEYRTHVQTYGWQGYRANGAMSGTSGQAKRLEAIQIRLTGEIAKHYDVQYRVHAQTYGWLGWAENNQMAGTAGLSKRLEGIEIRLVPKADGRYISSTPYPFVQSGHVAYRTHVQTYGWQGWKHNGQMSGTSGQAKRLEGIEIKLENAPYSGDIEYRTHVQTYGWQDWKKNGQMSGTSGEAKRLEAIQIRLTGEMAKHYNIRYRVHAQHFGWMGWAFGDNGHVIHSTRGGTYEGNMAGTAGYGYRLEGIEIELIPLSGNPTRSSYSTTNNPPFRQRL